MPQVLAKSVNREMIRGLMLCVVLCPLVVVLFHQECVNFVGKANPKGKGQTACECGGVSVPRLLCDIFILRSPNLYHLR